MDNISTCTSQARAGAAFPLHFQILHSRALRGSAPTGANLRPSRHASGLIYPTIFLPYAGISLPAPYPHTAMVDLRLETVPLARGAKRDPNLPVLKRVARDQIHPLRAHCFAATAIKFTAEQLVGIRNLPKSAATYVYEMEEDVRDTIKRHNASRSIKLDRPFAAGLLQTGAALHIS